MVKHGIQKRLKELREQLQDKARKEGKICTPEEVLEGFSADADVGKSWYSEKASGGVFHDQRDANNPEPDKT